MFVHHAFTCVRSNKLFSLIKFSFKTSQEKNSPFCICTVPNEQGKAARNKRSNWKLVTKADVEAKFGWEEKAIEQRNPKPQTLVSAKKVKKRNHISSAQICWLSVINCISASTKAHRQELSPSSSLRHFWGQQRNFWIVYYLCKKILSSYVKNYLH